MTAPTHLSKILDVTWCGQEMKRSRKPGPPVTRSDGGAIVQWPAAFDCSSCRRSIADASRYLRSILATCSLPEREDTEGLGCGDNSCHVRRPGGMATNGGCRCEKRMLQRGAMAWRAYALALEARATPTPPRGDRA